MAVSSIPGDSTLSTEKTQVKYQHTVRWGSWIAATVVIILGASLLWAVAVNPNIKWPRMGQFLFDGAILRGLGVTIELTIFAMVIGVLLGVVLALMKLSQNTVLKTTSGFYIWVFRGTPVLVQLIFWYNMALIFPRIGIGPFSADTNKVISTFGAAILALGLNEGAYMAEIVRAGILSVAKGQMDAALATGLTRRQAMRYIVIPQALRVILPPTGNQAIGMLKTTSIASVIAAQDLLTVTENIYAKTFLVIELLVVASLWYLVGTTVASIGQYFIEKKFGAGSSTSSVNLKDFIKEHVFNSSRANSALEHFNKGE
jgi:polar amino acid transport system permease protein